MDAVINIKGAIFPENAPPDIIEMVTTGQYIVKNGKRYISYNESEATGLEGVTTTLKVDDSGTVTLIRTGAARSRLVIAKGERQLCHYGTGYGDIMVGISGCQVKSKLNDKGGELSFKYTLDVNSSTISRNEIFISVREAKKQDDKSNEQSN
ncbi:hypothetical protein CCDG5_1955 [[Clostridium] cellulosi]|uniref:DUF1934 domain-containing protein n=1 Tax=[Clostridium] cellulosi TaxID=29343 RepID=A0A078KRA2_9FIRM|nr:MAG: DUF1934 domain-containing protein [[Clostridium] cellulosi]CDZ25047.1 hypothetical protein CCDG5_1955 [[Clostridium] cellulosi]